MGFRSSGLNWIPDGDFCFDLNDFYDDVYLACSSEEEALKLKNDVVCIMGAPLDTILAYIKVFGLRASSSCTDPRPRDPHARFSFLETKYRISSHRRIEPEEVIQYLNDKSGGAIIAALIPYQSLQVLHECLYHGPSEEEIDKKNLVWNAVIFQYEPRSVLHSVLIVGHTKIKRDGKEVVYMIIQNCRGLTFGLSGFALVPFDVKDFFLGFWGITIDRVQHG